MAPVVVEVDALAQPLVLLLRPSPAPTTAAASKSSEGPRVRTQAAHIARAGLRRIRLRSGEQMVVLHRARQIGLWEIFQQRRSLWRDARRRNHVRSSVRRELLKTGGIIDRWLA